MVNAVLYRGLLSTAARRSLALPACGTSARELFGGLYQRSYSSLPTIAQSSFWKQLIPKPLRRNKDGSLPVANAVSSARAAKEWNPATFYIFIFLFIGSMSIQMISLKKEFETFMRQSEVKIGLLREVIERVQRGEKVDVERVLGTGDPTKEAEWDSVLKELERDEVTKNFGRQEKKPAVSASPAVSQTSDPTVPTGPSSLKIASASSFY
ncbi:hypothetical protein SEPCBS119000_001032 [Sporothrix epigloea]|uniref:Uncharacterized protein n=1 Tax=Sporothrix epigloea TaxID=1892477 RepID=A0ABP0D8H0_9PEZI